MKTTSRFANAILGMLVVLGVGLVVTQASAFAHCDTLDGPVAIEALAALNSGDVTPVLKWVQGADEDEIKAVFKKALAVRSKGPEAREIADRYFLETLIRLHRAGEGAPFTGLKPAGTIEPSVAAADKAIEDGSVDALSEKIGRASKEAVRQRFDRLIAAKALKDQSIEAGREYVEAYVEYVHFVEALHNIIAQSGAHDVHADEKGRVGHGH